MDAEPIDFKGIIDHVLTLLETFEPKRVTPDSHLDAYLQSIKNDYETLEFIDELFTGVISSSMVLTAIIKSYFKRNTSALNEDRLKYRLIMYSTLFRASEFSTGELSSFLSCFNHLKLFNLLRFLFNERDICISSLATHYDVGYINTVLMPNLSSTRDRLSYFYQSLQAETTAVEVEVPQSSRSTTKSRTELTKIEPFALTRPAPRLAEIPAEPEVEEFKAKPIPKTLYSPDERLQRNIERAKEKNREITEELRSVKTPHYARDKARKKVVFVDEDKKEAKTFKARPAPKFTPHEVRLNTAAILKEHYLYQREQEERAAALLELEANMRDTTEFEERRLELEREDELKRLDEIEARRADIHTLHDRVVQEREASLLDKQISAMEMKHKKTVLLNDHHERLIESVEQQRHINEKKKRELARGVERSRQEIVEQKKDISEDMRKEASKRNKLLKIREARELKEKKEIIMQLRALHEAKATNVEYDPTSVVEHGLLIEMSLSELKSRLKLRKEEERHAEELKRNSIKEQKERDRAKISKKLDDIEKMRKHRQRRMQDKRNTMKTQKQASVEKHKRIREEHVLKTYDKLKAKREQQLKEKKRIMEANERVLRDQQIKSKTSKQSVVNYFTSMEENDERIVKDAQEQEVKRMRKANFFETKHKRQVKHNIDAVSGERQATISKIDQKLAKLRELKAQQDAEAERAKKQRVSTIRNATKPRKKRPSSLRKP
ncbi:hypothetical protein PCE1_004251 [Barthelona sp. PCE]